MEQGGIFGLLKPWWGRTGLKLQELSWKMRWSGCRGEENEMTDV